MMKMLFGAVSLIALATPALAQFEPLQFAICKKIPADADRLKCFDAIGPKPRTAEEEASDPTPIKGRWAYGESKSPIDDSDQVLAVLGGEPEGAMLAFRCIEHKTEAAFIPPAGFFATGRANVLVRIGDGTPETILMGVGTNGRALFAVPAADFMKLMPDNTKLFLRATGFQGRQADGTFDLVDVSVARDRVATTCHWSTEKANKAAAAPAAPVAKNTSAASTRK